MNRNSKRWWILPGVLIPALATCLFLMRHHSAPGNAVKSPSHETAESLIKEPSELSNPENDATPGTQRIGRAIAASAPAVVPGSGVPAQPHDHVKRSWSGHLEPKLLEIGRAFQGGTLQSFSYPLFDGQSVEITVFSFKEMGSDRGVISGAVKGYELSHVVLSQVGDAEAGTIQIPELGDYYEIRNGPEPGSVIVSEIDIHAIGECGVCAEQNDQTAAGTGE
jgi:hypothetical protein